MAWWLRSPGEKASLATFVSARGVIYNRGEAAKSKGIGVRPALWLD